MRYFICSNEKQYHSDFKQKVLPRLVDATRFLEENKMPLPDGSGTFGANRVAPALRGFPAVSDVWEFSRAAGSCRGVRTGGERGASGGRGENPGETCSGGPEPRPRAGEAFPAARSASRRALPHSLPEWRVRGACRRGCHGFRGSRGRARELPSAGRGRAGAGRRRGAAVAGAGGAGDAASPPGAAPVQPPHGAAARWEPSAEAAGPSRPPGPSAPRSQSVEPSAPSVLAWRPPGPRPVRGRGEGGSQAPAALEAG